MGHRKTKYIGSTWNNVLLFMLIIFISKSLVKDDFKNNMKVKGYYIIVYELP